MIYLDNNATTKTAPEVLEAMAPYYTEWYGNPHSAHALGRTAHQGVERARGQVAALLEADPAEIVFTSCGTESNAIAIRTVARGGRRRFVATTVEHPSVLALLRELETDGHELRLVGVDGSGTVDLEAMARAVDGADLVCVMLAQNETGVIHDVPAIAAMTRAAGAHLLVDAVQSAGKIPVEARALGADYLSISGHKFHAPKGIGALWIRSGAAAEPLWRGGGQEHGLRSGTEGVPIIVGLGKASELAKSGLPAMECVAELRDQLERQVLGSCEARVNGADSPRLPNTASISFKAADATALILRLDEAGICVSAGAACHSGVTRASATMVAMGVPPEYALGTIRFSLSRETTMDEIERTVAAVRAATRS